MPRRNQAMATESGESWTLNFRAYERETGDDIRNVNVSWENRSVSEVRDNLNAFLAMVGIRLKVVDAGE
jgi:hypothetical protein